MVTARARRPKPPEGGRDLIGFVVGKYFELGPDKKPDFNGIDRNIAEAVRWSRRLVRAGFPVFTPHLNTFHFEMRTRIDPDPIKNEEFYRAFDRRLLSEAVDFVFATPNWRQSSGGRLEVQLACHLGIPVFESIPDLVAWSEGGRKFKHVSSPEISDEALNFGSGDVPIVIVVGAHIVNYPELDTPATIENELIGEQAAVELFNNRIAAFTPQMNNSYRRLGLVAQNEFNALSYEMLIRVADAVYGLGNYRESLLADGLVKTAKRLPGKDGTPGKPVFTAIDDLIAWRDGRSAADAG